MDANFNKQAKGINTLRQAIADGHYLRLNLNFITQGASRFKRPQPYKHQPKELSDWKKAHEGDYFNVPIDSLDAYVQTLQDIRMYTDEFFEGQEEYTSETFEKIYINYMGRLQKYKNFSGHDKSDLRRDFNVQAALASPIATGENRRQEDFILGRPAVLEIKSEDYLWRKSRSQHTVAEPFDKTNPWQGFVFEDRDDDEFRQKLQGLKATDVFIAVAEPVIKLSKSYQYGDLNRQYQYIAWKVRSMESLSAELAHNL